jgi:hypothetical protein
MYLSQDDLLDGRYDYHDDDDDKDDDDSNMLSLNRNHGVRQ